MSLAHTQEARITQGGGYWEAGDHWWERRGRGGGDTVSETTYLRFWAVVLQQMPLRREKKQCIRVHM